MAERILDWMVRRGWLVASGNKSTHWCDEHNDYCPAVWYRPRRRAARP